MLKLSILAIRAAPPPTWRSCSDAGVRVMLDDCFSQGVIFPARRLHFNAYKLDMSIVNDAQHDPKALALIKAAYYCQLSGSRCVAEGWIHWRNLRS